MSAYGIALSPMTMQAQGAAAADGLQTSGRQAGGGGFAGTLLHAMGGGTNAGGNTAQTSALPLGLLGLAGLMGWNSAAETDAAPEGLLALLSGLAEQLGSLEGRVQLPAELQQQLAALLALAQQLLTQIENGETAAAGTQQAMQATLLNGEPKTGQALTAELAQVLRQLSDKLAQGQLTQAQTAVLAEPVRQAMIALQPFTGQKSNVVPFAVNPAADVSHEKTAEGAGTTQQQLPMERQAEGQTTVRWHTLSHQAPALDQGWTYGRAQAGMQAENASQNPLLFAAAAESADTPASGSTAPVWTLLKDSPQTVPHAGLANGQASLPQSVPVQQFVQEMGKYLVKQFVLTQGNGISEAKISLHPEHLGQLDIKIVIQNGVLTAKFVAETGAARELLEAQMAQLRTALQGQGLQVERMEVVQQPSQSYASHMGSHHGHHGTGHNGSGARKGNRSGYEEASAFEAELERTAFLRDFGYGGTLNVTA